MVSRYEYQPANRDLRLGRIAHGPAGGTALAWHEYAYSAGGEITAWSRGGAGRDSELWSLEHDKAGQLVSASRPEGPQEAWSYDLAGNRLSQQSGSGVSRGVFNGLNQLLRSEGGGQALFSGRTDEPAVVRVQSNETPEVKAEPRPDNGFRAWVPVEPGKNTVRITAQDGRQNTKTQSYELVVPTVAPRVFTYDANGNTLSDGLRSYEWDAENRLARVRHGDGSVTAFGYDGRGRRVWIEEKDAQGTVTSVRRYVWADGVQPAEERDGANTVLRRFYPEGEQAPGAAGSLDRLFYAKDHLGSVREVTDEAGVLRARYDYGFWGNRTRLSGDAETAVGYTGHHHHGKSGLVLTWYRAYDPDTGRWLSRDPLKEAELLPDGPNLYNYVGIRLVNRIDHVGQTSVDSFKSVWDCNYRKGDQGSMNPWRIFDEAMALEAKYMPSGHAAHNGGFAHCVANCLLVRRIGSGPAFCARKWWDSSETDPGDIAANKKGADLGKKRGPGGCIELCLAAFPPK
jgi:RHS repeat-associated protein